MIGVNLKLASSLLLFFSLLSPDRSFAEATGRFIVTLSKDQNPVTVAADYGVQPDFVYRHALNGFAARFPKTIQAQLQKDPRVLAMEPDSVMRAIETQPNAPWGLDRVDQRSLPLSTTYSYDYSGSGVTVFIIDTGIRYTHEDFGSRASFGFDSIGGDGSDCHGHGTHVAGIAAGRAYGIAKEANLVAVRVLDCGGSGTVSGVVAGVDWVTANHVGPSVANMSLGGSASAALDTAVRNMIISGVTTAVAAGNETSDACFSSPARTPEAITVGATGANDSRASFSNFGNCVDWFAPGVSIPSAWSTDDTATRILSGTSMASPHVAGAAALYLSHFQDATPDEVRNALFRFATKDIVTDARSLNNHLLYTLETTVTDPIAPFTKITRPLAGSTVRQFSRVIIEAIATDNVGVSKVEFYVNGVLKCIDTSAPYACSWQVPFTFFTRTYQLQTKAHDAAGNVGSSAIVSVRARF